MPRIAFTGAAGTGKTTLVEALFKLPQFKHYKRYTNVQRTLSNYLDNFPHSSNTNDISQSTITGSFVLELLKEENIICDRSLLDTFMYSETSEQVKLSEEIEYTFNKALELYDVIFYTPIEFTVEEDGFRDTDEDYITETDRKLQEFIKKYKNAVKIVEVNGTVEERLATILKNIEGI